MPGRDLESSGLPGPSRIPDSGWRRFRNEVKGGTSGSPTAVSYTSTDAIEAELVYTVDDGTRPVTSTAGVHEVLEERRGTREPHRMTIHDGRAAGGFSLDVEGFVFVRHETRVTDFYDPEQIRKVYYPETEALVQRETGASRVLVFDHTLRAADERLRDAKQVRDAVRAVHNDYTEWSGPQRVRDLLPKEEAEKLLEHRFLVVQVWRPTGAPVEATPLAIADARSIASEDLIASERRYPDRVGEIYQLRYNPAHRWFWFPAMRRDEALVFKCYDSMTDGRARWTAHTGFDHPAPRADAPPRESIEIRSFAFFAPV
jgi:hypothetical protein